MNIESNSGQSTNLLKLMIMKQMHKNVMLSRTKCVNNILKIWLLAQPEDRYDWYVEAYQFASKLAESNDLNINQVCGVIAALSPRKYWNENKKLTLTLIQSGTCKHMKVFKEKAQRIIQSTGTEEDIMKILNGQKIQAFYLNIRYPDKALNMTIDRHALSVALGRWTNDSDYAGMTAKQYDFFVECYRIAGARLNVNPLIVQSATWLIWRKIKKTYPNVQLKLF